MLASRDWKQMHEKYRHLLEKALEKDWLGLKNCD
jgi:hypothetical protein